MAVKNILIKYTLNFILLYFLVVPALSNSFAKKYFINNKIGNDKNNGLSINSPWASISKINSTKFQHGDSILFSVNCTWREELNLISGGRLEAPIYIGKYGNGNLPKIFGSEAFVNWELENKNIWKTHSNLNPNWIWFVNNTINWGTKVYNYSELKNNFDFFIDSNIVYVYLLETPLSYKSIEISVRDFGIISGWYGNKISNIIIENLELCFTKNANIRAIGCENWIIRNSILHHSGGIDESDGQGIQWEGKNGKFIKNKIFENGQHGIFISSFGNYNVEKNLIDGNEIFNNYHTAIDLMNDGGDENSHINSTIKRNLIYDFKKFSGKEVGIQTLGYGNGKVKEVIIHHNIIIALKGIGISIMYNSKNINIHNNTIIETESSCVNIDNGLGEIELYNNIGINNNYYAVLFLSDLFNKSIGNNIWYTNKSSPTKNVFIKNNYYSDLSEYLYQLGKDVKDTFVNPKLNIKEFSVSVQNYSPVINNGRKLNYLSDFYDNKIVDRIDIGAVEYIK